jgi:hypothetical protein
MARSNAGEKNYGDVNPVLADYTSSTSGRSVITPF